MLKKKKKKILKNGVKRVNLNQARHTKKDLKVNLNHNFIIYVVIILQLATKGLAYAENYNNTMPTTNISPSKFTLTQVPIKKRDILI